MFLRSLPTRFSHKVASAPYFNWIITLKTSPAAFPLLYVRLKIGSITLSPTVCGVASRIQDGMTHLFNPDRTHFSAWVSVHDINEPFHGHLLSEQCKASLLYYATLCGISSLVKYLMVTRRLDPNESCGGLGIPLHAAVFSGHIDGTVITGLLCGRGLPGL